MYNRQKRLHSMFRKNQGGMACEGHQSRARTAKQISLILVRALSFAVPF